MSKRDSDNPTPHDLNEVLQVVNDLAVKSAGGDYIYRGERRIHPNVASSLYRQWYEVIGDDGFDIEIIQREILDQAKSYARYTGETDDFEILSQLQHNGGATNLIDFTTDFLIALFFACDGDPGERGQVILLSKTGSDYHIEEPRIPIHRVIAQKSVFVRPVKGFVEPDDTVIVSAHMKPLILDYLRSRHGISAETIYNDLLGFIHYQEIHRSAYAEYYKGATLVEKQNYGEAIGHFTDIINAGSNPQMAPIYNSRGMAYSRIGEFQKAIDDYESSLKFAPEHPAVYSNMGNAYVGQGYYDRAIEIYTRALELGANNRALCNRVLCNRGEAWLRLGEWEKARTDLKAAESRGMDVPASFHNDYGSVADFERINNLEVPEDIARILGG